MGSKSIKSTKNQHFSVGESISLVKRPKTVGPIGLPLAVAVALFYPLLTLDAILYYVALIIGEEYNCLVICQAIAALVADYWVREEQRMLIAAIQGVQADNEANDAGDQINDIALGGAGTPTAANLFSAEAVIDT